VTWEGNVARGRGTISALTGAFEGLPYSLATRIDRPDGKTSPEELLAAAHAACYAMSLANELASSGKEPEHLDVRATVTLDEVEGGSHRIVASELLARACKRNGRSGAPAGGRGRERGLSIFSAGRGQRSGDRADDTRGRNRWRLIARPR
jgi:OsmC subfamily peroxiredoxin